MRVLDSEGFRVLEALGFGVLWFRNWGLGVLGFRANMGLTSVDWTLVGLDRVDEVVGLHGPGPCRPWPKKVLA